MCGRTALPCWRGVCRACSLNGCRWNPPLSPRAVAAAVTPAAVTFEQVRFRYRPELPEVHHGVTFAIPPRGMTAFVGPSGAGKATVFALIERFYEPGAGQILLDGTKLQDWPIVS
jgi:ABC-type multidrug transport system fused ATPase/permease subunit